ncbi:hypothetical protein ILUMI_19242 [Ignelater luminosus]|uniref:Reverse transcriptase domain-containing protein n=1 Tax=Ignelater luminosus TaxID=2038154 RepID=A0A8K0CKX1_IGNLU|nr:hypothetical protein ILUMI_19242 [Ignelater luminosus]
MQELEIPPYLASLIRITLSQVECHVRVQNNVSCTFTTQNGWHQGDSLSTILFSLVLEKAAREANINTRGIIINKSVEILAYADDVDIITRSKRDVIHAFVSLEEDAKKIGLRINPEKTK